MSNNVTIELAALQRAVHANLAYWAAMRELERTLSPDVELTDQASDHLTDAVEDLACSSPPDAHHSGRTNVGTTELHLVLERIKGL
jgi:hypothetical protein